MRKFCFFDKVCVCFSSVIIVDRLSVERNYVLVKTFLVGSGSERILPSRTIAAVSVVKHHDKQN